MKILILEDNLKALDVIDQALKEIEAEIEKIDVTIFSEGRIARDFAEKNDLDKFDVILLDYLSRDDLSFHEAVIGRASLEKVITISNTPAYNNLALEKGVLRAVQKNYFDLGGFKVKIKKEILNILNK